MHGIDVDIRDLTIEYASGGYLVRPIHDLDLQVASGELVLLLGASGSGKTTLLSALAAILRPMAGTIRVGDVEVTALRGAALTEYRRHRVGVVFQTFNLVPGLTARCRSSSSTCIRDQNDSTTALSKQAPTPHIEGTSPDALARWLNTQEVNCPGSRGRRNIGLLSGV